MSTINDTDLLLVERNGIQYQITYDQMSTLNDDDLLLVERGGVQYKVEAQHVSTGANGIIIPPVEVLTPVNGAGITEFDQYEPVSSAITAVGEASTLAKPTDNISSVADESAWNESQVWSELVTASNNIDASYPVTNGFDGSITTLIGANVGQTLTLNFGTTFSSTPVALEVYSAYGRNISVDGTLIGAAPAGSTGGWLDCGTLAFTEIAAANFSGGGGAIYAIKVNGQLLVDAVDDSQVWSTTGVFSNTSSIASLFDGDLSTYWLSNAYTISGYTFASIVPGTKFELFFGASLSTVHFAVNGQTPVYASVANSGTWIDVTDAVYNSGQGGLSSIQVSYTPGQYSQYIHAIKVDGKMLIDEGVRTAPTSGKKILTFPTNTNFSGLSVGDEVINEVDDSDGALVQDWNDNFHFAVENPGGKTFIPQNPNGVGTIENGLLAFDSDLSVSNRAATVAGTGYGYWLDIPEPFNATSVSVYTSTGGSQYTMYVEVIDDTGATVKQSFVDGSQTIHYFDVNTTSLTGKIVSIVAWMSNNRLTMWGYRALIDGVYREFIDSSFRTTIVSITDIDATYTQEEVYATWNPSESSNKTLTNGDLNAASTGAGIAKATMQLTSGKWYWEVTSTNGYTSIGLAESSIEPSSITWLGQNSASGVSYSYYSYNGSKYTNGSETAYGATYSDGDVIGIALDLDAGTLNFYKNGVDQGTAFTGLTGSYTPAFGNEQAGTSVSANFGATAFTHTPPSGHTGLSETVTTYPTVTVDGGTWDTSIQSETWSLGLTTPSNSFNGGQPAASAFDGDLSTFAGAGAVGEDFVFQPATPVNYLNKVEVYTAQAGQMTLNSGSPVATTDATGWVTLVSGSSGSINTITIDPNSNRRATLHAIRVDGNLLVDGFENSQVWSSGTYSGTAANNNYGVTDLFANVGNAGEPFGASKLWGLYQATATFTLDNPIPLTSNSTLDLITYQSGSSSGSITLTGSAGSLEPTLTVNGTNVLGKTTVSDPYASLGSSITAITIAASGADWTGLEGIIVDGKSVIDAVNDSQVWSSGGQTTGLQSGYDWDKAFNGDLSTGNWAWLAVAGGTLTWESPVPLTGEVEMWIPSGKDGIQSFSLNGGTGVLGVGNSYISLGTLNDEVATITSTGQGASGAEFFDIKVGGKMLVDLDDSLGDRNLTSSITYEKSLTFTDSTQLANMVAPLEMTDANGAVVTPVSDTITNVNNNVLTLASDSNISYFQPGDEVQTGVQVVSVDAAAPSITVDGGEWQGSDGTSTAEVTKKSLRFNSDDSAFLQRVQASAGNRKTWTWSGWVKRSKLSTGNQHIFDSSSSPYTGLYFTASDDLIFRHFSGSNVWILETDRKFRDPNKWIHIVLNYDTTQSTASDRLAMYIDGVKETSFSTETYPSLNYESSVNNNATHQIGTIAGMSFFDGYMTDINFVDGLALNAAAFGEFDSNGVWKAKDYSFDRYDDSQVWSSNAISTVGTPLSGKGLTQMFNGNIDNSESSYSYYESNSSASTVTFNPPLETTDGSNVKMYISAYQAGNGQGVQINGSSATLADVPGTGTPPKLFDLGVQSLSSISWTAPGGTNLRLSNPVVDGKILVDAGVTVTDHSYKLDFSDNSSAEALGKDSSGLSLTLPSVEFDGNDHIHLPSGDAFAFGTGDFTVEAFVYHASRGVSDYIIDGRNGAQGTNTWSISYGYTGGSALQFATSSPGHTALLTAPSNPPVGKWFHLAVTRSGTSLKMFIDGVEVASATDSTNFSTAPTQSFIGTRFSSQSYLNGNISNLRVVKGTAVYTSNFTVPTTPLENVANTVLLCFQTARGAAYASVDRTVAAVSPGQLSTGGNPRAELFGPANFTPYVLSVESPTSLPSVDFDGNDLLTVPSFTTAPQGTNDFTIEFYAWFDFGTNSSYKVVAWPAESSHPNYRISVAVENGKYFLGDAANYPASWYSSKNDLASYTSVVAPSKKWHHVALQRVSGVDTIYVDGQVQFTASGHTASSLSVTGNWSIGGGQSSTNHMIGKLSNFRVLNGNGLYSSTFTPPSLPLTNIAGTVLLCCQSGSSATAAAVSTGTLTTTGDPTAATFSDSTAENDSSVDVPANIGNDTGVGGEVRGSYATISPLANGGLTLSNGNLHIANSVNDWKSAFATIGVSSGKWYWEVLLESGSNCMIGIAKISATLNTYFGASDEGWAYNAGDGHKYNTNSHSAYGSTWTSGDIMGVAFDADSGTLAFYKNGTVQDSGTAAFTGLTDGTYLPAIANYGSTAFINFGARQFSYAAPSGYKALCNSNLPEATIKDGSKYFNAVTFTGNGSTQSVDLEFSPDLLWIKDRDNSRLHALCDSVRGDGKLIYTSSTLAEQDIGSSVVNLTDNGFDLGFNSTFTAVSHNHSGADLVAYAWNAGDTTVTNNDGDLTSQVRANPEAGFSIVTYTGNSVANSSVGHGLGTAPEFVITKATSGASRWWAQHTGLSAGHYLELNSTIVETAYGAQSLADPTSTTFDTIWAQGLNESGVDYVGYCFAPVEGYSAMGSYMGNGSTDGSFVYTGFKPAWIMIKSVTSGDPGHWMIVDTKRSPSNPADNRLHADLSNPEFENNGPDILSNGFKLRNSSTIGNISGTKYIYVAFAENPLAQVAQSVAAGDTQVSLDAPLAAAATEILETDGTTMYLNGVTGPWRTGLSIEGSQINAAAPGPSEITFTSQNQGTPVFSGVSANLASRTWTLETASASTGPWSQVDTYSDFGVLNTQTGATPWTENKPTLQPNTYYRIKVAYNSTNAPSVESVFNTFKTGAA